MVHLELRQGTRFSSRVGIGNSGFISSCNGELGIHLILLQGD